MKNSPAVDRLRFLIRQAEQGQRSSVTLTLGDAKDILSKLLDYEGQKTGRKHNAGVDNG